jgi:hypothetical protein
MTALNNTVPPARMHRKRRFHIRPQSLGSGFEKFDVPDFRVNRSNPMQRSRKAQDDLNAPDSRVNHPDPIRNNLKTQDDFNVTGFRASRSNTDVNFGFRPEPSQYVTGWFNCVGWPLLAGFIAVNFDLNGPLSLLFGVLLGLALLISRCFE